MKHIKTWSERCEEHPDHQQGMVSKSMIQARMQEEIDELRQALEVDVGNCYGDGTVYRGQRSKDSSVTTYTVKTIEAKREWVGLTADEIWKCNKTKSGSAVEFHICYEHQNVEDFAEAIEAKLKEKNT